MNLNRLWVFGSVILIAATAVLGWLLGISPKLIEASAADANRVVVETQNSASEGQVAALKKQFDNIGQLKNDLASLRSAVPNAAEIPAFVAQLDAIAEQHQVTLAAMVVSDAQLYVPVPVVAPGAAGAAPVGGAAPAPTPAPTPTAPTAAEVAAAAAPVPGKAITATNFVSVPISVSVTGSYPDILDFIEGLQKGTRLVMVTKFATAAADSPSGATSASTGTAAPATSDTVTTTISALIYVLLDPAAAAPAPAG